MRATGKLDPRRPRDRQEQPAAAAAGTAPIAERQRPGVRLHGTAIVELPLHRRGTRTAAGEFHQRAAREVVKDRVVTQILRHSSLPRDLKGSRVIDRPIISPIQKTTVPTEHHGARIVDDPSVQNGAAGRVDRQTGTCVHVDLILTAESSTRPDRDPISARYFNDVMAER